MSTLLNICFINYLLETCYCTFINFRQTLILVFEVIMQPPKHALAFQIGIFFHILAHCEVQKAVEGKEKKY